MSGFFGQLQHKMIYSSSNKSCTWRGGILRAERRIAYCHLIKTRAPGSASWSAPSKSPGFRPRNFTSLSARGEPGLRREVGSGWGEWICAPLRSCQRGRRAFHVKAGWCLVRPRFTRGGGDVWKPWMELHSSLARKARVIQLIKLVRRLVPACV